MSLPTAFYTFLIRPVFNCSILFDCVRNNNPLFVMSPPASPPGLRIQILSSWPAPNKFRPDHETQWVASIMFIQALEGCLIYYDFFIIGIKLSPSEQRVLGPFRNLECAGVFTRFSFNLFHRFFRNLLCTCSIRVRNHFTLSKFIKADPVKYINFATAFYLALWRVYSKYWVPVIWL